jgi:Tol biopolymer transport system component
MGRVRPPAFIAIALTLVACSSSEALRTLGDAGVDSDASADATVDAMPQPQPQHLLYLADQEQDGLDELFLLTIEPDGTTVVAKVNGDTDGRSVRRFEWSPGRDAVSYVAGGALDEEVQELFVVPIDGAVPGPAKRVNGPLAMSGDTIVGDVRNEEWSPDGSVIVYSADSEVDGENRLFLVDPAIGRSSAVPITDGSAAYEWSPDGNWIAYRALRDGHHELFAMAIIGGAAQSPIRISGSSSVVPEVGLGNAAFAWSPDGRWLFYFAEQEVENREELFGVAFASGQPGPPVRLNAALQEDEDVSEARWSPDGSRLLYLAGHSSAQGLFVLELGDDAAGAPIEVSSGLYPVEFGVRPYPMWSPDSTRVAFFGLAFDPINRPIEVFVIDVAAEPIAAPTRLNAPLEMSASVVQANGECTPLAWSRDSSRLTYVADQEELNRFELWTVAFDGRTPGAGVRSNGPLPDNANITTCPFSWSPVERTLLYRAQQDTLPVDELYVVSASDLGSPIRVNGPMVENGEVLHTSARDRHFTWSPDGRFIVYLADQDVDDRFDLFVSGAFAIGSSMRVNPDLVEGGDVRRFVWEP